MDYCKIEHREKRVSFTDGRKGVEYYVHIKSRALIQDYKARFDALKDRNLNEDLLTDYYNLLSVGGWRTLVGTYKNYSLEDLCTDLKDEVVEKFNCDEGSWTGCIRPDGIYLNIRAYKFD